MLETWEIRWFGEGSIPLKLQQWSEELGFTTQPVRSDYYYLYANGKDLGIKWREGSIQIKERIEMNSRAAIELYRKWSFELADGQSTGMLESSSQWCAVTKKRDMIKWRLKDGELKLIDIEEHVEMGCEVEVAAVILNDHLWWTVAYEATGGEHVLQKTLNKFNPPIPADAQCMGYAEWIINNST